MSNLLLKCQAEANKKSNGLLSCFYSNFSTAVYTVHMWHVTAQML